MNLNGSRPFLLIWAIGLGGCASAPEVGNLTIQKEHAHHQQRTQMVTVARDLIGTPYRYGGSDESGFDCSGLVRYVHRRVGIRVPRTVRGQRAQARSVLVSNMRSGDLVFFEIDGDKGRHVGIYEGGGRFIHAPSSGKHVSRALIHNPYWRKRLVGVGSYF